MKNLLLCIALIACSINVYGDINLVNETGKELDVTYNPKYIIIEYQEGFMLYRGSFKIPSKKYFEVLDNAKIYMPTMVVTLDEEGKPVFKLPPTVKALKQEIEKIKQAERVKIEAEVKSAAIAQLPSGVTRIVSEYALPCEEQPKKE